MIIYVQTFNFSGNKKHVFITNQINRVGKRFSTESDYLMYF